MDSAAKPSRLRAGAIGATLAVAILGSTLLASPASAAGCKHIPLRVSKKVVESGGAVRVVGRTCGSARGHRQVRIQLRGKHGWRAVARIRVRRNGRFQRRVRIEAGAVRFTRLRAAARGARSRSLRVRIRRPLLPGSPSVPGDDVPVAPPSGDGGACGLGAAPVPVSMAMPGCRLVSADTAAGADPRGIWGEVECGTTWGEPDYSRQRLLGGSGDLNVTALGAPQGNTAFRRLTTYDGDDYSGERCELGLNDYRAGQGVVYREGQRRATYFSMRLPDNFPLATRTWQTVMQMKQAQPSDGGGGVPILFMGAYANQWHVESSETPDEHWTFPAEAGVWTRFAWDVSYSKDSQKGWVQVSADLNGDGDFDDEGERSPVMSQATLKTETSGPNGTGDGLAAGEAIPSHLRMGIYHNPTIPCPAPTGCSAEVDNVQVIAP